MRPNLRQLYLIYNVNYAVLCMCVSAKIVNRPYNGMEKRGAKLYICFQLKYFLHYFSYLYAIIFNVTTSMVDMENETEFSIYYLK